MFQSNISINYFELMNGRDDGQEKADCAFELDQTVTMQLTVKNFNIPSKQGLIISRDKAEADYILKIRGLK